MSSVRFCVSVSPIISRCVRVLPENVLPDPSPGTAVIGSRAVVSKDVAPYSVVSGNPARLVKKRFDEDAIKKLLQIQWWNWPVEKINKHIHLICSQKIDEFLKIDDSL